jgi:hypothetical protein
VLSSIFVTLRRDKLENFEPRNHKDTGMPGSFVPDEISVKAGSCLPGFRLFQPASRKLSAASLELWVGNQRQFA